MANLKRQMLLTEEEKRRMRVNEDIHLFPFITACFQDWLSLLHLKKWASRKFW